MMHLLGSARLWVGAALCLPVMIAPAPAQTQFTITGKLDFAQNSANPVNPVGPPVTDAAGNQYGVSINGGNATCKCGEVFELSPPTKPGVTTWYGKVLYRFNHNANGYQPEGGLALDAHGNLFGTTTQENMSQPTAFELSPPATAGGAWTFHVIHHFGSPSDEGNPRAVTTDAAGNVYGSTDGDPFTFGGGVAFRLSPPATSGGVWGYTVLHSFTGGADGGSFIGPLRFRNPAKPASGLYGTTAGTTDQGGSVASTIFHLTPPRSGTGSWTKTIDATLSNTAGPVEPIDGVYPVTVGSTLFLVGTSEAGGDPTCQCGTVFAFDTATRKTTVLHKFTGQASQNGAAYIAAPHALSSGGFLIVGVSQFGGPANAGSVWHLTGLHYSSTASIKFVDDHDCTAVPGDCNIPNGLTAVTVKSPGPAGTAPPESIFEDIAFFYEAQRSISESGGFVRGRITGLPQ